MAQPNTLSYCAEQVRGHDGDRFLTALFATPEIRESLFALYAFNLEVSKTREVVSETMLGAIRLQWWREAVDTLYSDVPIRKHAVVEALATAVGDCGLSRIHFDQLIDGRMLDLEEAPLSSVDDLMAYADSTSGSLVFLAMEALGGRLREGAIEVGRNVGIAWAIVGLIRAMPHHLQRGRVYLPDELIARNDVDRRSMLNLKTSTQLNNAVAELAAIAREKLAAARLLRREVPKECIAALLPAVLADTYLKRLAQCGNNAFDIALSKPVGLATGRLAYRAFVGRY